MASSERPSSVLLLLGPSRLRARQLGETSFHLWSLDLKVSPAQSFVNQPFTFLQQSPDCMVAGLVSAANRPYSCCSTGMESGHLARGDPVPLQVAGRRGQMDPLQ